MTNTVLIKRSSVANAVPVAGDLQSGELAINYTDGNLFYKNSSDAVTVIASNKFVSVTGNVTGGNLLTGGLISATGNITGSNINTNGIVSASGITYGLELTSTQSSGDEGGQVNLAIPATNTALTGQVTIDIYQNKLRFFQGDSAKGAYIDLTAAAAGVGSNLLSGSSVTPGGSNTYVQFNDGSTFGGNGQFVYNKVTNVVTAGAFAANTNGTGLNFQVGDDGYIGDINTADTIGIKGAQSNGANGYIVFGNADATGKLGRAGTGPLTYTGEFSATSNVTGGNLLTSGLISATGTVTGSSLLGSVVSASGNVTGGNVLTGGLISATGTVTGSSLLGSVVSASANITGGNLLTGGIISATGNVSGGNVAAATAIFSLGTVGASGNTSGGNLTTTGQISATGNITGGNLLTGGLISASANITGGNILTGGLISAAGNITGGNIVTSGTSGNISGANVISGTTLSATGNITGGNILTSGQISATGNITGGNVSATNHTGTNVSVTGTVTAASTVGGVITGTSASVSGTVTSASVVGGVMTGTSLSVSANVTGGNLLTSGLISAASHIGSVVSVSANITGGNILTGGLISATGNITGGNLNTTGQLSTSGNLSANNISVTNNLTASVVSASGNVTGGNILTDNIVGSGTLNIVASTIALAPVGNVTMNSRYINNLADPVQDQDAATKKYVDDVAQGLNIHDATKAATPNTLAVLSGGTTTYDNGPTNNGAGATITTTGTYTTIDGVSINTANTRILVFNEANAVWNGIYVYSNSTVLTRASDYNSVPEVEPGDFVFNLSGTIYGNTGWVQTSAVSNIGQAGNNIVFTQFSGAGAYTANTSAGLSLLGTVFSAKVDNISTSFDGSGNIVVKPGAQLTTPDIGEATGTSLSVTGTVTAASTVGGVITGSSSSVTGNVTGGNVLTSGQVSATGNITGGNLLTTGALSTSGNLQANNISASNSLTASIISASANITGGNLLTGGIVSSTGNVTGGNVLSSGSISASTTVFGAGLSIGSGGAQVTGNITGGNLRTAGQVSATGNITGGNILTSGLISATGNVTGNYFIGNGSQLTGISASSNSISNGTSNVSIPTADGSVYVSSDGIPNAAVFENGSLTLAGSFATPKIITADSIIAANVNATLLGPLTLAAGVTITVPSSSTLYIGP